MLTASSLGLGHLGIRLVSLTILLVIPSSILDGAAACPPGQPRTDTCGLVGARGHLSGTGITIALFAQGLGPHLNRVVIDRSGLDGRFSLDLDYAPAFGGASPSDTPADQRAPGTAPSLARALEEQLGLTLVPAVASVSAWWLTDVERLHEP